MRRLAVGAFLAASLLSGAVEAAGVSRETRNNLRAGLAEARQEAVKVALREGGAEAVELVLPLAAIDKDGGVRDRAFVELAKLRADGAAAAIAAGLRARDARIRAVTAELLGDRRDAGAAEVEALVAALGDDDLEVRRAAAWAAGQVKARAAAAALAAFAEEEGDLRLRSIAVESYSRIGPPGAAERLSSWAAEGGPDVVRAQAIVSLGFHDRDEAGRRIAEALAAAAGDVRGGRLVLAALETAERVRRAETVPGILGLLDHPRGRVVDRAFAAARAVTGMELPADPAAWREWWEHYGDGFEVPAKGSGPAAGGSRSRVRFYGAPIVSDRVVFVIDESGSMRDPGSDGEPKIDGARAALEEALDAMEPSAMFNVIGFGDGPRPFKERLVPATDRNVRDARRFLKAAGPRGRTNVFDALELALEDPEADAAVLLSDGAPSVGRFEYYQRIRRHVGFANLLRGASFSCVALTDSDAARRFLKRLADESGGTYTER